MLNAIRSINPIWVYALLAGAALGAAVALGFETGAVEPVARFFVAVYAHVAGYFRTVLHAL